MAILFCCQCPGLPTELVWAGMMDDELSPPAGLSGVFGRSNNWPRHVLGSSTPPEKTDRVNNTDTVVPSNHSDSVWIGLHQFMFGVLERKISNPWLWRAAREVRSRSRTAIFAALVDSRPVDNLGRRNDFRTAEAEYTRVFTENNVI